MPRRIDQATLDAIGNKQGAQGLNQLANSIKGAAQYRDSRNQQAKENEYRDATMEMQRGQNAFANMSQAKSFQEQQKQNANQQKLRELQMTGEKINQEKSQYDLAQSRLDDEIQATQRDSRERYLKNQPPKVPVNATEEDYLKLAQNAFANNADKMGANYLLMAQEAATAPSGGGSAPRLAKLQAHEKAQVKAGDFDGAKETRATINTITDPSAKEPAYDVKSFEAAELKVKALVGEGSEGFASAVSEQMNNIQRRIQEVTQKMPNLDGVKSKVLAELKKGEGAYFIDDNNVDDELDPIRLEEFIRDESIYTIGGKTREEMTSLALGKGKTLRELTDSLKRFLKLDGLI